MNESRFRIVPPEATDPLEASSGPGSEYHPLPMGDRRFLLTIAGIYTALIVLLTLTISPYFAQGWDVTTFIAAAGSLLDGQHSPLALYQQSRADFYWPYAYPPLHALLVAPFLLLHRLLPILPESLLARLPVLLFDLGLAWFLYTEVGKRTPIDADKRRLGLLAAILWLFNPVTLYHTAVQAHFESEWVLLVLLAYSLVTTEAQRTQRMPGVFVFSLLLAAAILVKQIAVIYALPCWLYLWLAGKRREMLVSGIVTALAVGLVCLPFALYSDDFLFMVTSYVTQMPLQTQSWLVWLLLLKEQLTSSHTSNLILLRYSTPIVAILATLVSAWGLLPIATERHRSTQNLYRLGLLITLVFFLFSSKVMGYYYAILIPFLLLVLLPQRRLGLLALGLAMLSWILLSPYYASWSGPEHLWLYAALGTVNSAFFCYLGFQVSRSTFHVDTPRTWNVGHGTLAAVVTALGLALAVPILFQPLHAIPWVAGRQDLSELLAGGLLLIVTLVLVLPLTRVLSRWVGETSLRWPLLVAALYFPLTFMQFYVTRESTRVVEMLWP